MPDFDLLIVALHSANPKVRGNAIEAIASGVDNATYRRLDPLISRRPAKVAEAGTGEIVPLLQEAIDEGGAFQAVAAAQALRDYVPAEALAGHLRGALKPGMPAMFRDSLATLLSLEAAPKPTVVDLIAALRALPEFGSATLEALAVLAERASPQPFGRRPTEAALAGGGSVWLSRADIDDVAARYPDLR